MARVITFSRVFPSYHPKAGHPTHFVEQILNNVLPKQKNGVIDLKSLSEKVLPIVNDFFLLDGQMEKKHTIREGKRWKEGEYFSPRVWSGKPYNSPQIIIAPDIQIKKQFKWSVCSEGWFWIEGNKIESTNDFETLAKNDGLKADELYHWFMPPNKKVRPVSGQIICWDESVNYG